MYKIVAIVLSTLLIAAFQIQAASAGCGDGHGGFHAYQSKAPSRHAAQQSRARKAQLAAAKQKKAAQIARAEKAADKKVEEPQTASATFAETKSETASTEVSDEKVTVAAIEGTCTKFVAATGTTVTVECAKQ
jgi:sRNA-binding protein